MARHRLRHAWLNRLSLTITAPGKDATDGGPHEWVLHLLSGDEFVGVAVSDDFPDLSSTGVSTFIEPLPASVLVIILREGSTRVVRMGYTDATRAVGLHFGPPPG